MEDGRCSKDCLPACDFCQFAIVNSFNEFNLVDYCIYNSTNIEPYYQCDNFKCKNLEKKEQKNEQ